VLLYESPVRAKLRPSNGSTAARIDDDVLVLLEIDRTYNEPPLFEYPYTLRPFRPKQVSFTGETNRHSRASYRSRRFRDAVVAISMDDGRA
jgi:hypothetical protein